MTFPDFPIRLDRPLVFFDIESTGVNRKTDRIVELALIKIWPDGRREEFVFRVNPEIPIPPEVTAIHGLRDEDVRDAPPFRELAPRIAAILDHCDLAGYNINYFDIPVLTEEFARAGLTFTTEGRRILDAQRIYHRKVPRDLAAAMLYYCNEPHTDAHRALGDVEAAIRVFQGQMAMYPDLPRDLAGLDAYCHPKDPAWVDRAGRFKWDGDEAVLNFGKKQGTKLRWLAREDPGFLQWMIKSDFPEETRAIARNALKGAFPAKSEAGG